MPAADLAWMLSAFGLVLLMFPGIALFYGGMLNSRSVLNMFMMIMGSMAVTAVIYVLFVHGLVLGNSVGGAGIIGDPTAYLGFQSFMEDTGDGETTIGADAYWGAFYILFAAISIAIVASGAAGRMRYGAWLVFSALWVVLVYAPLAHWVFAFGDEENGVVGGWMRTQLGLHDYAGGTAVHMNAGASAVALAMVLGARRGNTGRPHNLPLVLLGAGLLFFGWIGFNGGTAGGANFLAGYVTLTTLLAALTGVIGYLLVERIREGHATVLGMATGLISGLVAITPAADAVSPLGALATGFLGGGIVALIMGWKHRLKIDDSLDAFSVHGIGGIVGALFVVFFAAAAAPAGIAGIATGGGLDLLWRELVAIVVTVAYSFGVTYAIAWGMNKVSPIRVDEEAEHAGLDLVLHAETAYDLERSAPVSPVLSSAVPGPVEPGGDASREEVGAASAGGARA
ncbi:ammonium transporter [Quadrisphaera granulorum]|uniref:Ammonium transporter n=1 Tax=Quadrisphaera granulorum TaxID=317664 RepID=A0A316AY68_9ACTN|nr:ammonium transporter [Quadrisphaera granulorum]PWJ55157.1 ammonium transporter [Quadrisphaera granulorum]SZE95666.1 ammonium transporter [Quadrisphaera granulorum]